MASADIQSRDWQCDMSLVQCLDHLFTSGIACDVTFVVGECKDRISAHKTILISRSPVFNAMLEGPLAEKGEISITNIAMETFSMFLRYLYTDDIKLSINVATPILSVARMYCVDQLVKKVEIFLMENLTAENACLLLENSHIFMEENLKEDCLRVIERNADTVLKSDNFLELCSACVKDITGSDSLAVAESEIFEAVIRFADAELERQGLQVTEVNRREVLGDILYTVRFPIMDKKRFARNVSCMNILTRKELININRSRESGGNIYCKKFSTKKRRSRKPEKGRYELIARFGRTRRARRHIWNSCTSDDSISFTSSHDLYLHGLRLYGAHDGSEEITLGIYTCGCDVVNRLNHILSHDTYCDVEFEDVIMLRHGETYDVIIHGGIHATAYGLDGVVTAAFGEAVITFSDCLSHPCVCTNTKQGQIPGLLLSM